MIKKLSIIITCGNPGIHGHVTVHEMLLRPSLYMCDIHMRDDKGFDSFYGGDRKNLSFWLLIVLKTNAVITNRPGYRAGS